MNPLPSAALTALALAAPLPAQHDPAPRPARVLASLELAGAGEERLADTDGDGAVELLVVRDGLHGQSARLERYRLDQGELVADGGIELMHPAHTLLAIADLLPAPGDEIVVADPDGISCRTFARRGEAPPPIVLAARARFLVGVQRPAWSPFVADLNRDGRPDLLLPSQRGVQPYLHDGVDDAGRPRFRRLELVPVPIAVTVRTGGAGLDGELAGTLTIPPIRTLDLNGDGRPDMLTQQGQVHGFHLQQVDGSFAPPIEVDLGQFVDSTPAAMLAPGSTIVLGDRQLLQRGDIDGDGIPDHVIAHRRKIWTFLSDQRGPQFRKARTQAVADDVTAMLVVDLDDDERADLLTFRVQFPGVGSLLLGLVRSIDIDIRAVGHRSADGGFERTPQWRRTVTLRIPPLLSLLQRQDELLQRFVATIGRVRLSARGILADSGGIDAAVVAADGEALELFAAVGEAPQLSSRYGRQLLRRLLFEDPDTVFDLDRVFALLSGLIDELVDAGAADRRPVDQFPLLAAAQWRIVDLLVGDLDGVPGDELLVVYRAADDSGRRRYEVISWRNRN